MTDNANPDHIVTKFIDFINDLDLESATSLLSEDCEYDNVPMGKVFGREAIFQQLTPMIERCEEIEWITHRQTCTGTTVMNERNDRFLWPHGWVEMPCAGIFEVVDGKITLWRDYFDLPTYTNQLPAPSE
ncbi:MAG: limonene-1,2-epoxide hydrolase family protein [Actinomycetota bacterium]|nr:limonene-1,2-epoxide hydrolase family protein [Actinomycetota bacterium]|tara:strand:- start:412 stop:801 length:390 start_codon:yes stop_codon:yes gene_type:complete